MFVVVPMRRFLVDFDISCPNGFANPDFSIEEIGSRIGVWSSRRNDFNGFPISGFQVVLQIQPVFPDKLQKLFFHYIGGVIFDWLCVF
jgi:hypothetical protein